MEKHKQFLATKSGKDRQQMPHSLYHLLYSMVLSKKIFQPQMIKLTDY